MSGYQFEKGDYILFQRIVQPEKNVGHETDPRTGRLVISPRIPEQILPQRGQGCIVKVQTKPRKVEIDRTRKGEPVYEEVRTATVTAGPALGRVCAVLDDATLDAKPLTLDLDVATVKESGPNVYGTDGRIA